MSVIGISSAPSGKTSTMLNWFCASLHAFSGVFRKLLPRLKPYSRRKHFVSKFIVPSTLVGNPTRKQHRRARPPSSRQVDRIRVQQQFRRTNCAECIVYAHVGYAETAV